MTTIRSNGHRIGVYVAEEDDAHAGIGLIGRKHKKTTFSSILSNARCPKARRNRRTE